MKFCYVDESFSGNREWFFLAGFILRVEHAARLADEVESALPSDEFQKMDTLKDLRAGSTFSVDRRNQLSDELYTHLDKEIDYTVVAVIIQDQDSTSTEQNLYFSALYLLLERLDWIYDRDGEFLSVYLDAHQHTDEIQQRQFDLQQRGTLYRDLDGIVGVAAPISDELSFGIQLADLVAAGIRAHFLGIESRYYVKYILDHIDRHPRHGGISGVGIKLAGNESDLAYEVDRTSF